MPSSTRIMAPQIKKTGRKIKAGNTPTEKLPGYEPNIPEPTSREELLKYWLNISLDERTANKVLWLTEGGAKVSRMTDEVCPYLDRPERFDHSPQGAARKASDGPCGLGENEESWGLGWAGSCYETWHKAISSRVTDVPQCCTIGVYVDQPAGLLCFYTVETEEDSKKKEVKLLHRFKNPIKEKIVPGFWVGRQSSYLFKEDSDTGVCGQQGLPVRLEPELEGGREQQVSGEQRWAPGEGRWSQSEALRVSAASLFSADLWRLSRTALPAQLLLSTGGA
ncbi:hypothetical protein QQF64_021613, partial [Cirrhinus molitorella]